MTGVKEIEKAILNARDQGNLGLDEIHKLTAYLAKLRGREVGRLAEYAKARCRFRPSYDTDYVYGRIVRYCSSQDVFELLTDYGEKHFWPRHETEVLEDDDAVDKKWKKP